MDSLDILKTPASAEYALLDSGDGEKLEQFGNILVSRPDPQALWSKKLSAEVWQNADAIFSRADEKSEKVDKAGWKLKNEIPERWQIAMADLKLWVKPTSFKHVGLFPEQMPNWNWIREVIKTRPEKVSVLNLFGYTGGATLAAASAGAEVTHVDGSKVAINWAKDNAEASGLTEKPIRWILDDARAYVRREIKRGKKYDGIIMDPPAFGHGPKGELWKIEDDFLELLKMCREILTEKPLFFLINGYASGYSSIAYENNLKDLMKDFNGKTQIGELAIEEKDSGRLLPSGIFARWESIK
jgi:23S rRNA (cytosine1962-C5)-methyltransferase